MIVFGLFSVWKWASSRKFDNKSDSSYNTCIDTETGAINGRYVKNTNSLQIH